MTRETRLSYEGNSIVAATYGLRIAKRTAELWTALRLKGEKEGFMALLQL
jgi:hypothetical protein